MPIPLVLATLARQGLGLIADAVIARGRQAVEEKLGVQIPDEPSALTPDRIAALADAQRAHERFLVEATQRAEDTAQGAVSARWQADMASDNRLSKNIRPLTLAYLLLACTLLALADAFGTIALRDSWVGLFESALLLVLGAYFVGRSVEKGVDIVQRTRRPKP